MFSHHEFNVVDLLVRQFTNLPINKKSSTSQTSATMKYTYLFNENIEKFRRSGYFIFTAGTCASCSLNRRRGRVTTLWGAAEVTLDALMHYCRT